MELVLQLSCQFLNNTLAPVAAMYDAQMRDLESGVATASARVQYLRANVALGDADRVYETARSLLNDLWKAATE